MKPRVELADSAVRGHMASSLSKKTCIAVEAVLYIACHVSGRPVRSREICEYQGVALRYLEHILQALVREGILKGVRGPRGGYVLARERRKIAVREIWDAVQLLEAEDKPATASPLYAKVLHPMCRQMQETIREQLTGVTLQDLCDKAERAGVGASSATRPDFTI